MPDPYHAVGKQVLRGSVHVCNAATPEVAEEIVRAMGARASIAAWIDRENQKRKHSRYFHRLMAVIAEGVRNRFDEPDEAAPEGVRASYNEDTAA